MAVQGEAKKDAMLFLCASKRVFSNAPFGNSRDNFYLPQTFSFNIQ